MKMKMIKMKKRDIMKKKKMKIDIIINLKKGNLLLAKFIKLNM